MLQSLLRTVSITGNIPTYGVRDEHCYHYFSFYILCMMFLSFLFLIALSFHVWSIVSMLLIIIVPHPQLGCFVAAQSFPFPLPLPRSPSLPLLGEHENQHRYTTNAAV